MVKKIMYPQGRDKVHCLGKGGNRGATYMMETAIDMLIQQGHSGDRSKIMMVGDRFDTDVRGGVSVGILTCLVESGCHQYKLQPFYPADTCDFVAESVAALHPLRVSPAGDVPVDRTLTPTLRLVRTPISPLYLPYISPISPGAHALGPAHLAAHLDALAVEHLLPPPRRSRPP